MPYAKSGCLLAYILLAICLVTVPHMALAATQTDSTQQAHRSQSDPEQGEIDNNVLPEYIGGLPLGEFLASRGYLHTLRKKAIKHEQKYGACATPTFKGRVQTGRPQVMRSIPDFGMVPQWIEIVEIGGCKESHELNVLIALINGAPKFYPLLPGDGLSLLDFTITQDVMTTLINFEKSHALTAGCKKSDPIRIHHIRLTTYKKEEEDIVWNEIWDVSNCKTQKSLNVYFTANPTSGTHFTIHQPDPVKSVAKKKPDIKNIHP